MDVFMAWASLEFLFIATIGVIIMWRAIIYVWDLFEVGGEKLGDWMGRKIGGNK